MLVLLCDSFPRSNRDQILPLVPSFDVFAIPIDKLAAKAKDPVKIATAFMGLFQNPVRRRDSAYRTGRSRADRGVEGGDMEYDLWGPLRFVSRSIVVENFVETTNNGCLAALRCIGNIEIPVRYWSSLKTEGGLSTMQGGGVVFVVCCVQVLLDLLLSDTQIK